MLYDSKLAATTDVLKCIEFIFVELDALVLILEFYQLKIIALPVFNIR